MLDMRAGPRTAEPPVFAHSEAAPAAEPRICPYRAGAGLPVAPEDPSGTGIVRAVFSTDDSASHNHYYASGGDDEAPSSRSAEPPVPALTEALAVSPRTEQATPGQSGPDDQCQRSDRDQHGSRRVEFPL